MKTSFYVFFVTLALASGSTLAQPSRVNVDGTWYTNGQTAYLDCGKSSVPVFVDVHTDLGPDGYPVVATLKTQTSSNFSTTDTGSDVQKTLNLDGNHQDGFIKTSYSDFSQGSFTTIYISQKPPIPTLGNIPTLCSSGNTGTLSAQVNYSLQSTKPANLVWQTNGGITINGGNNYTLNGSTSGSAPLQFNSRGTVVVYAIIPGCNNLQGPSAGPIYFGSPQLTDFTFDNSTNSGPHPVSSGSTHYFSNTAAFGYVPSYSISANTNSGNIILNLTGVNGGSGQINVSGSIGNATLHINASNSCGTDARDEVFYIPYSYRASPNPARSSMAVAFDGTDDINALPDRIDIVSEKEQSVVRSINMKDTSEKKAFRNGNEILFDIKDLTRGTYYLRVINSRQVKDKQVEMTRLIFE